LFTAITEIVSNEVLITSTKQQKNSY